MLRQPRNDSEREGGEVLLYEKVAAKMRGMIENGTFRTGDRIPSIRAFSRQAQVSANTVMDAYGYLENLGLIEARPQSGFYVCPRLTEPKNREVRKQDFAPPNTVALGEIQLQVMRNLSDGSLVPLGRGIPNPDLLPVDKLNRMLAVETRRFRIQSVSYSGGKGVKKLRAQIARRMLGSGCSLAPEDIAITSGCVEAVTLALLATCSPGDTVAIASPVYYTFLNSIQWMGLKVLEIPSTAEEGINLDVLGYAIKTTPVHACIVIANFSNPLGSVMSDDKKRGLVALLAEHDIPLIEDDVYGDLHYGQVRPSSTKAYDEKGLVLYCSSFSKTLAPGYRIGWIAAGKFQQKVEDIKALMNIATATPTQLAVAEFLANGGYDHHLRSARRVYAKQIDQVRDAIGRHFPQGTRVTYPKGGFVLWVEMPEQVDALVLHREALREGISIAPGMVFTTGEQYRNCIRVNSAFWSERIEQALETVGGMAAGMV